MSKILISGGSGLLGAHLVPFLEAKGFMPAILSRDKSNVDKAIYHWDLSKANIDVESLQGASAIIHLAGAGIAEKAWTSKRKKEILESRVKSSELLFDTLKKTNHGIKTIISASAVGIYGDGGEDLKTEDSAIDKGFLQETCVAWEKSVRCFEELGIRVVILRIGVVLAKNGGALPQMALPIKLFVGAPLGSGKQFISWIHIDDLCGIITYVLMNEEINGVFNAVSSIPLSNKDFYKVLASNLSRPLWPVSVPSFLLQIILGEKSEIILHGQKVSNAKIRMAGYKFKYVSLNEAIASFNL